jgi:hypothetical protein
MHDTISPPRIDGWDVIALDCRKSIRVIDRFGFKSEGSLSPQIVPGGTAWPLLEPYLGRSSCVNARIGGVQKSGRVSL